MIDWDAIKAKVDIASVIGGAVALKRQGGLLKGCCPFHAEKTPSFTVYDDHAHCYGCGWHGDVVDFVMAIDNCDAQEAIRKLGAGEITMDAQTEKIVTQRQQQQERDREAAIAKALADWEGAEPASEDHPYLVKKKIDPWISRQVGKALLIPINDAEGNLMSIQRIGPECQKQFVKDAPVKGGRLAVGLAVGRTIICEGFATGMSIYEASRDRVLIGFSSGGVKDLARELHGRGIDIAIAADRTGLGDYIALGKELGVPVYAPPAPHDDFNDMAVDDSIEAVRDCLGREPLAAALVEHPSNCEKQVRHAYENGISAAALMAKQFEPVNYVVTGLLAEGVTLFVGAPKIGKSWLVLDLALSVASGKSMFGSMTVSQGDVLYLALEDNERRLKSRLQHMGVKDAPQRLTLVTEWPGLDRGCIEELKEWVEASKKPTLIIIDVLRMVRPASRGNSAIYEEDYRAIAPLASFARENGIAVVLVHHTRKSEADDPLESASGTNGLTGAADSVMVLKRDSGTGNCKLYVRGRDIEESEKIVRFNGARGTWELQGEAGEVGRTDEREEVLGVLRQSTGPLSPKEVSDLTGKKNETVRARLSRMARNGEIEKEGRGKYTCHKRHNVTNGDETDNVTDVTGLGLEHEHSSSIRRG